MKLSDNDSWGDCPVHWKNYVKSKAENGVLVPSMRLHKHLWNDYRATKIEGWVIFEDEADMVMFILKWS
jgi:hypothetical protein